ncbi:hypothetical protein Bhyg_16016 [Pseudolycoriella hygida]|uniref:Uncharacterized protein n=1 Tax=Pseudolycoriella hygida TaxID=35572 RepID=A0A9Q0MKM5_9DIPT|nr:hypothetical protein Bhyg_16016 [Pseudolycoriella hygida]
MSLSSIQQQRSTRIDQIMKLFPEQNPHMSHPSQQQQQLLLQHQLSSNQSSSNILALSGSQSSINQSCNFPLAMECDPPALSLSNVRYGGHVHRGRFPASSLLQQPTQNVGHKTNYLSSYAPASLPIDLGQMSGSTLNSYPLNLSGSGGGSGSSSLVGYQSFPMTEPASLQMVSNSKINSRSNVSSNDRDESPMMCVQQSPVVIH